MENQQFTGNEGDKNPSRNKPGTPGKNPEQDKTKFDSPNREGEINPGKLDREEIDLDRSGIDNSKGHEPYEFKNEDDDSNQQGGDRSLTEGSNNLGVSGGAGGAQFGQGSNTPGRGSSVENQGQRNGVGGGNDSKIQSGNQNEGKLVGQGGYGTSGTNGSNPSGTQGYQSGLGSAGSQNGSTGYNAGSQGMNQKKNDEKSLRD